MLPAYVALSIVVEFLLILFHLSVAAFIARHIVVGPKQYRNAFFIIYLLQSVADLADYLTVRFAWLQKHDTENGEPWLVSPLWNEI